MTDFETFLVEMDGAVARVTMNRPRKANCLNATMWRELKSVFDELDAAEGVRVVVLAGQGRFFSAGIDLEYLFTVQQTLSRMSEGRKQEYLHHFIIDLQASVNAIENCCKPVLAAIQGVCIGGGLDIAAACDLRYATAKARFCVKEVDLAIVADLGVLQRLPGIVGQGIARELALTGRQFNGREAGSLGLVNGVFATAGEMQESVMATARGLAAKSPLTLRGIKATMNFSRDHSVAEGLGFVAARNAAMLLSPDLEEAVSAAMEKREPLFDD
jgi:enoyl-CoA hydratase